MKKIFYFILAVMLTVTLIGCGKKERLDGIAVDQELDTSENVKIYFWHRMGSANQLLLETFIAEFEELYPHIEVIHEKKADDYTLLQDVTQKNVSIGNEPHMVESYGDHVAGYIRAGAALEMNNLINNTTSDGKGGIIGLTEEDIADFVPGYWAEGMSYDDKGTMYSLAFSKSTEAMFYNKTFFEANDFDVPETWAEAVTLSRTIKAMPGKANTIPLGYDSTDNLFIVASEQQKIPYTTATGEILFNNDRAKAMVTYFKDLYDEGLFTTKEANNNSNTSNLFVAQNLFMSIGSTGGTRYNVPQGSEAATFEVGVAPVPQFDMENAKQMQQGPNINMFKKENPQEMLASWLFLKYITDTDQTIRWATATGYSPVRLSAYETQHYIDFVASKPANPANKAQAEQKAIIAVLEMAEEVADRFFTSPVFGKSSKVRQQVGAIFQKVFVGRDINTVFNEAYEEASF